MDGNVEITHIDFPDSERLSAENKYDFSFLSQIEEIKGYLLIFHVHVGYLPFDNLKIIRGQTLFGKFKLGILFYSYWAWEIGKALSCVVGYCVAYRFDLRMEVANGGGGIQLTPRK